MMLGRSEKTQAQWLIAWACWSGGLLILFWLLVELEELLANWHLALLGALFLGGVAVVAMDSIETAILSRERTAKKR